MTGDFAQDRSPARRRRWVRAAAVLPVCAAALVVAAVSSAAPASAAAPPDEYTVCLPSMPCMPIADATVTGTVFWNANANVYRGVNDRLPLVTVWFTEIDGGRETNLPPVRVVRGRPEAGTLQIKPATDALRIALCNGASTAPTPDCRNTTVSR